MEFSQKKLESNFSNYSAWHYRSKLLPLCFPSSPPPLPSGSSHSSSVQEDKLLQEFDLVTSAVFTDPNDQSAWFYQQWLLGRVSQAQSLLFFIHSPSNQKLAVVFNQSVSGELLKEVQVLRSEERVELEWKPHGAYPGWPSCVWTSLFTPQDYSAPVQCRFKSSFLNLTLSALECSATTLASEEVSGPAESMTAAKSSLVQTHCESICELLKLEPDNKWCHLTALQLRWAMDPEANASLIGEHFSTLEVLDPYRRAYYQDLRSRYLLEERASRLLKQELSTLSLSGLGLTRLYHTQYFASLASLDLSNNRLSCMSGFAYLVTCQELNLNDNFITEVEEDILDLEQLRILRLKNNSIASQNSLHLLNKMAVLEQLCLEGNPVLQGADSSQIASIFSKLSIVQDSTPNLS